MVALLQRETFETSRAAEYFSIQELQAQTGQPVARFPDVVLKELIDNALDACETAGVAPEIDVVIARDADAGALRIVVGDNGPGLPATTIKKIRNFETRTSDKAAYRSPTRGAQGNALKTVLGIPPALGGDKPIRISAQGLRHRVRLWADPAGHVRDDTGASLLGGRKTGTLISVPLRRQQGAWVRWSWWVRGFALFNPHASVKIRFAEKGSLGANTAPRGVQGFYQRSAAYPGGRWRKFTPTDPTSPWWYTVDDLRRLVFAHIAQARAGGTDKLLRDFVREFRGLSGSAKAKAVCDALPGIRRLSDFDACPEAIHDLLHTMVDHSSAPSADVLGALGEEHLRARIDLLYRVKPSRWWYRKEAGLTVDNIPYMIEVAIAETERPGATFSGVNFSPTYDDPLADTWLSLPDEGVGGQGVKGFLSAADVIPWRDSLGAEPAKVAIVFHLTMPALPVLDRAKTRIQLPRQVEQAVVKALWACAKTLHREAEARRKDAVRQQRHQEQAEKEHDRQEKRAPFTACIPEVVQEAYQAGTGGGRFRISNRDLYYALRPLLERFGYAPDELGFGYFSTIIADYRLRPDAPAMPLLYYDARGKLYEPHTGNEVEIGTREVEDYTFPTWRFDKILYIEKKGVWEALKDSGLAERYDMAVIAAEGYATEAIRTLLKRAEQQHRYTIFVFHDADPYGYNIARTLTEETARMPGYHVDVIDLGLKLRDALAMGLTTETFTRKKALPQGLDLTVEERDYFEGEQVVFGKRPQWKATRVEINAIPVGERAAFLVGKIEDVLAARGVPDKIIPPDDLLQAEAASVAKTALGTWVRAELERRIGLETIAQRLAVRWESQAASVVDAPRAWVDTAFKREIDRYQSWDGVLATEAKARLDEYLDAHKKDFLSELTEAVREQIERVQSAVETEISGEGAA